MQVRLPARTFDVAVDVYEDINWTYVYWHIYCKLITGKLPFQEYKEMSLEEVLKQMEVYI